MSVKTVPVSIIVNDASGAPVAGAAIVAKLSQAEVYMGYVVPVEVATVADSDGMATLNLWPNALGSTESVYTVRITDPRNGRSLKVTATIPDGPCELHQVADLPPFPGKTDGQLAVEEGVATIVRLLAEAGDSTELSAESAVQARVAAGTATQAASDASASQIASAASAAIASDSAAQAVERATALAAQAGVATEQASIATDRASAAAEFAATALLAKEAAVASKDIAATKAGEADASANAAAVAAAQLASQLHAFNEMYLGQRESNPATDGNGNPLKDGAIYQNTVDDKLYAYENGVWSPYDAESQAHLNSAILSAGNAAASAAAASISESNAAVALTAANTAISTAEKAVRDAQTAAGSAQAWAGQVSVGLIHIDDVIAVVDASASAAAQSASGAAAKAQIVADAATAAGSARDVANAQALVAADAATRAAQSADSAAQVAASVAGKQDALVSGTNIKTINGVSVLGSGDLQIAAGGLANLTEISKIGDQYGAYPVPLFGLTTVSTSDNASLVLSPKGTGALQACMRDDSGAGGYQRGDYAVDWQLVRGAPDSVGSGAYSSIGGGSNNKASGTYSVVSGGSSNLASGNGSVVAGGSSNKANHTSGSTVGGGSSNTASGQWSVIAGGNSNTASGSGASTVSGGTNNTADGQSSVIPGGVGAATRGVIGAYAWAGYGTTGGKTQREEFLLRANTTAASSVPLTTNGGGANVSNSVAPPINSSYLCRVRVVARNPANGATSAFSGEFLLTKQATAATTLVVNGPVTLNSDIAGSGLAGITAVASANTSLGCLALTVTGLASTTLNWLAHVETLEVTA